MELDLRVPDPTAMSKLLIGCVVPRPNAWEMNNTSGDYPPGVDELVQVGLTAGHQYAHVHDIFELKRPAPGNRG